MKYHKGFALVRSHQHKQKEKKRQDDTETGSLPVLRWRQQRDRHYSISNLMCELFCPAPLSLSLFMMSLPEAGLGAGNFSDGLLNVGLVLVCVITFLYFFLFVWNCLFSSCFYCSFFSIYVSLFIYLFLSANLILMDSLTQFFS